MNKEKIDLSKPKKEYKKFQKESESLVDELKIDKEEQEDEILEEELEAKFWRDLYKEKLKEVLGDKDFIKTAICDLEEGIKLGKSNDGYNANWALKIISNYKNLGIFNRETGEGLKKVLDDENFKKISISYLEDNIKLGKNGDGWNANWALRSISSYTNLGIFDSETGEGLKEILDDKDFKKVAINDLEGDIKSGKNGDGADANWAFWTISAYKNVSEYFKDLAENKKAIKARDDIKTESISKRPEIK